MFTVQTEKEIGIDDVRATLSDSLGRSYQVTVASASTLKVGHSGVMPTRVKMSQANGTTTFTTSNSGLLVSRLIQAVTVNRRIRQALRQAYPERASILT